jgi:phosphatidylglycerol---prolipoprotein diacylglyceryl transferase
MINSIIWNANPEIFSIGPLSVRWYGLLFALGIVASYYTLQYIFKKEKLPQTMLDKFAVWAVLATVIGARLGHVLFYEPEYFFAHPSEILMVWHGGLASHGATIGLILTVIIFSLKYKIPMLWLFDRMAVIVPVAAGSIRLGNLMNSEIFGHATNLPWGFVFKRADEYSNLPLKDIPACHPTQLYEALVYFSLFIAMVLWYRHKKGAIQGGLFVGVMFLVIFVARFFIEFIKNTQVGFEEGMALNMGQLLSIPFILLGLLFIFLAFKLKYIPKITTPKQFANKP